MLKKLKRVAPVLVAALTLAVLVPTPPVQADRAYSYCDPEKSKFCRGLVALYELEEDANNPRTSETGSAMMIEQSNSSVARSATKKTGSYSLDHTAASNKYIFIPHTVGFTGTFTINFWIYINTAPSASGKKSDVLCMSGNEAFPGWPCIYLQYADATHSYVKVDVKQAMTDTVTTLTNGAVSATDNALTASAWHMVTIGEYPSPTTSEPFQQTLWMEIDGYARSSTTLTYPGVGTLGSLVLGSYAGGTGNWEYCAYKVDQLGVWSWSWSTGNVDTFYNSGSGREFPFTAGF